MTQQPNIVIAYAYEIDAIYINGQYAGDVWPSMNAAEIIEIVSGVKPDVREFKTWLLEDVPVMLDEKDLK